MKELQYYTTKNGFNPMQEKTNNDIDPMDLPDATAKVEPEVSNNNNVAPMDLPNL